MISRAFLTFIHVDVVTEFLILLILTFLNQRGKIRNFGEGFTRLTLGNTCGSSGVNFVGVAALLTPSVLPTVFLFSRVLTMSLQ